MSDATVAADVTEAAFPQRVLDASHDRAVVVDFWAPWCAPCHQLAPLLEGVASRYAGDVDLVKLNVDEAPAVARQHRVQSIPVVKAFRDGRVVAELTGVQPERTLDQFFASLAPSEADRLTAQAVEAAESEREALLRRALDADPAHGRANVALARLLADRGAAEEARGLLDRVPGDDEAQRLRAELSLAGDGSPTESLAELRAAADGGDGHARVRLGRALAGTGAYAEALEVLLAAARDPATREDARVAMLDVFALLGDEDDLVRRYRPKLAAALY